MATDPNVTQFPTPPAPLPAEGRPLARKMATVLSEVHRVPKNGRNDFHGYDYVYESDLVDHIRDKLAEQGVAIFPSVREHSVAELEDGRGRTQYLTTVTLDVSLVDGESGDQMTTTWVGQGLDSGDKGYYKAYTGAIKYFLLKTFLISTGDDPETEDVEPPASAPRRKPRPSQRAANDESEAPTAKQKWEARAQEFEALLEEAVEEPTREAFTALYVERMGASSLEDIGAQKVGAMCRKLRGMNADARADYVRGVIADNEASSSEEE